MRDRLRRSAGTAAAVAADTVMVVWKDGLQGGARRNAWSAMVADSRRARERAGVAESLSATATGTSTAMAVPGS